MKKLLLFLPCVALFVGCSSNGQSGSGDSSDTKKTDTTASKKSTTETKPATSSTGAWTYSTDTDKMTSKQRYFAAVEATNKLQFQAPYEGGSTGTVTVRTQDAKNEVILTIDKGQFVCNMSDGCAINIRFDSDPAIKFTGSEPSDGSSTTLFIEEAAKFITQAKKAKKMIVQAEFYESGMQNMEFTIDGFKWDH